MAADQVRGAAADAIQRRTLAQRLDHARMRGQTEIIVAAERQHRAAVDLPPRRAGRVGGAPTAAQAVLVERLQLGFQLSEQFHGRSAITCSNTARVRAASPSISASSRIYGGIRYTVWPIGRSSNSCSSAVVKKRREKVAAPPWSSTASRAQVQPR